MVAQAVYLHILNYIHTNELAVDYHKDNNLIIDHPLYSLEEYEKASNAYVMSFVAIMISLPLPIINLIATLGYYVANRKSTYFVRWHITQALLAQVPLLFTNAYAFGWTVSLFLSKEAIGKSYGLYVILVIVLNLAEFILIAYTADRIRKGRHTKWAIICWVTDALTHRRP